MTRKAVFLYVTSAGGHQQAADAVRGVLEKKNPGTQTFGCDSLIRSFPTLGPVFERFYFELIKHTPQIWDYLYDNKKVRSATKEIRELFNAASTRSLTKLLREQGPDCLVCTQALPCSWIASQKRAGKLRVPLVGIVTDYAVHAYWLNHETDAYIVAHEDIKPYLVSRGIAASRIHVTGIPIDPAFSRLPGKIETKKKLGFHPNQPVIMIMGGGHGLGPVFTTIKSFLQIPVPLQMIVIAGMNKRRHRELKKKYRGSRQIRVLGFTRQVPRLMAASDLLITKPGGLTSSEALAAGLPMLIYNPLPGQEQRNTRFLISHGAADKVNTLEELLESIHRLLTQSDELLKMRSAALGIAHPHAAERAAEIIQALIERK